MATDLVIILAAVAVGLAILAILIAGFVLARRSARSAAQADVDQIVTQLTGRVDDLAGDLQQALENAESEGRRGRILVDLAASIDLDEVLQRTLDAAAALPGADAALVSVHADNGGPLVAATGIAPEEAVNQSFAGPPDGTAEAVLITYRYAEGNEGSVQSTLAAPLKTEGGEVGWIAVYSRTRTDIDQVAGTDLSELAMRAGPAVNNALRFREAKRLADLDALTGLHNRRFFHETLAREVSRAERYGRRLAIALVDLDNFKAINERIGHLAGDGVLAEAADRIRSVVRAADIACRVGGDEFAVILPESGLPQAEQLYHRIQHAVSTRPVGAIQRVTLSAGVAELQEGDDSTSLFERADQALFRAKEAGKARSYPALAPEPGQEPPANSNPGAA